MIIGFAGWLAICGSVILLVAVGGLLSSLVNRAYLRKISMKLDVTEAKLDHNTKNSKMMQELVKRVLKEQGRVKNELFDHEKEESDDGTG